MAFVENQGAKIYWEEEGAGEPLVLIMGLASTIDMWHRTKPLMAEHYRTILVENRGVAMVGNKRRRNRGICDPQERNSTSR